MIKVEVFCDNCHRDCTSDNVDLNPIRHNGNSIEYSNRTIQLCMECFNRLFNRDFSISFVPQEDLEGGGDFYA